MSAITITRFVCDHCGLKTEEPYRGRAVDLHIPKDWIHIIISKDKTREIIYLCHDCCCLSIKTILNTAAFYERPQERKKL